jgi:YfiH family protein
MLSATISPILTQFKEIKHGFFGREGGVSHDHPSFESLNVGFNKGDSDENVLENRRLICQHFGLTIDDLVLAHQDHTTVFYLVDQPFKGEAPIGDALITTTPNLLLSIQTADCVPVLFFNPDNKIIAAAHAGWRGAAKGVMEAVVEKMIDMGAKKDRIYVALGPCIWQESYQVGEDFIEALKNYPGAYQEQFLIKDETPGYFYFDLPGYVHHRLQKVGLQHIDPSPFNTFTNPEEFFSYRYKTVNHLPYNGQQLSVICLKNS